jgi:hypothetical protein
MLAGPIGDDVAIRDHLVCPTRILAAGPTRGDTLTEP